MELYLVRHGKTIDHENNVRQTPESLLGKIGHKQAKAVAKKLSNESFDVLFASPWPRALKTAEYISKKINLPVSINEFLHEQHVNPALHNLPYEHHLNKRYIVEANKFGRNDMDWKFEGGGESRREMIHRAEKIRSMLIQNYINKRVLIVSHGNFLSILIASLLFSDLDEEFIWKSSFAFGSMENTGITLITYNLERSRWTLKYFNDHGHLNSHA